MTRQSTIVTRQSTIGTILVLACFAGAPAPGTLAGPARPDPAPPLLPAIAAGASDPIFTTYAAPLARSDYLVDEAYHLRFYSPREPLALTTDTAGAFGVGFMLGSQIVHAVGDYTTPPVIRQSYANLARFDFEPFDGILVEATFTVHSSRDSLLALQITNRGERPQRLTCYTFATAPPDGYAPVSVVAGGRAFLFGHVEPRAAWSESPPPEYINVFEDLLLIDPAPGAWAALSGGEEALLHELRRGRLSGDDAVPAERASEAPGWARALTLATVLHLDPGASSSVRIVRSVEPRDADTSGADRMLQRAERLLGLDLDELAREAAEPYRHVPRLTLDPDRELIYRGAMSLARQCMLPPEGRARHNYYVFSREPVWSWGHDGQVFHESLSMLAYAYMDPQSAMDSQRIFMDAQDPDGYIPYRIGPYIVRTFPVEGHKTTSAPFYSWINLEVYRIAHAAARQGRPDVSDAEVQRFLEDAYDSGVRFTRFLLAERDRDGDGLLEWGGHAVLESVRDSLVPLWDLLGRDDPTAPSRVEALDLSTMVVQEMRSLADLARALGRDAEAADWDRRAGALARLINDTMWDPETRFYYNVDRETNRFVTPDGHDLRRMEIIGFLPLWAGIASPEQAEALVGHLTDPRKFWRRFGVPTLAADDPGYQPLVTRCCQWNGAVWPEWSYLVFRGLLRYDRHDLACELAERTIDAAATQLRRNHRFWESYSPDHVAIGSPANYIWNSILARMLIDLRELQIADCVPRQARDGPEPAEGRIAD